ncbi:transmembrane protein 192-like [Anopheles marshallii]|uniref:transmembrane protein 192-like n=1 Tax=Anopheles marshallii TaxID=1521116 RepID=UPI00237AA329|nr:transmembrane protein 192-like [Anopheles marshallii]
MSTSFLTRGLSSFLFKSFAIGSSSAAGRNAGPNQSLFHSTSNTEPDDSIHFDKLQTVPSACIQLFVTIALTIISVIYTLQQCDTTTVCLYYYMLLYLRGVYWAIVYLIHLYTKSRHLYLNRCGHHSFATKVHRHKKSSLKLVTLSNTILLIVHTALGHSFGETFMQRCFVDGFSSVVFVASFTLLETMIIVPVQLSYIVHVRVFNLTRPMPDAQQSANDLSLRICPTEEYSVNDSFKSITDPKEFILLQSAMISKLKEENSQLSSRIQEAKNLVELVPNQSLNYSLAEQSIVGGY